MKSSICTTYQHDIATVFEHLIYYRDFEKWNPDEGILSIEMLNENGRYAGFKVKCEIDSRVATLTCEAIHFEEYKEVRYKAVQSEFEDGADLRSLWSFPYNNLYQRLTFNGNDSVCEVIHEVYIEPRSWWGWLACKLGVLPQTIKEVVKSNDALNEYLATRI